MRWKGRCLAHCHTGLGTYSRCPLRGAGAESAATSPPSAQGDAESRAQGLGLLHPVSEMESQSQGTLQGATGEGTPLRGPLLRS